jgi:DNA (cytosine-5)-methyltransferase 1
VSVFYSDNDPFVIEWIENLTRAGHLPHGALDARSIREITGDDVRHHNQAHFFAGIGGWSLALKYAGWPEDAEVWTGSCPCQPFSSAGRGGGFDDERHLWPEWFRLIRQCRPPVVVGEQVASPYGLAWLDLVQADLEREGYSVGAADLCAAGIGAPHIRQRLYFVALADGERLERVRVQLRERATRQAVPEARGRGADSALADAGGAPSFWSNCDWIPCRDPRHGVVYRPVEPGTFPLASRIPNRVGRVRAYGNAIVSEVAATFIRAVIDVLAKE